MASDKDASCANDPDFAVICAFLEKFADKLQLNYPSFNQLHDWLINTEEVPDGLRDLHVKLMRKTRRTVHECAWESALTKFCFTYSSQDGWEIERFGYKKSSLKVKLRILRGLLEGQFDFNKKFRAKLVDIGADSLRGQPIGRDRFGHTYWMTRDADCNIRIYQEHLDEEIWQLVATNRDELVKLISSFKANEVILPSDIGIIDEDSSSNSCSMPLEKPPPPEEKDDSQESNMSMEGRIPNIKIRLENNDNAVLMNGESVASMCENGSKENVEPKQEKKVKPLVISHSKITTEKLKKRALEVKDSEETNVIAIKRPTLLDSNREKRLSKYEKQGDDDDEDDDDENEEDDEEDGDSGEDTDDEDSDDDDTEDVEGSDKDVPPAVSQSRQNFNPKREVNGFGRNTFLGRRVNSPVTPMLSEESEDDDELEEPEKPERPKDKGESDKAEDRSEGQIKEENLEKETPKEPERSDVSENSGKAEVIEDLDTAEKIDEPGKLEGLEKAEGLETAEISKRLEQPEGKSQLDISEKIEKPDYPEKQQIELENPDKPENMGISQTLEKTSASDKVEQLPELEEPQNCEIPMDIDENVEVGEPIEDPLLIVNGEGNGLDCETGTFEFPFLGAPHNEIEFSEVIVDPVFVVMGEGGGSECLVGNTKTRATDSKAKYVFGQSGCIKVNPIKKSINSRSTKDIVRDETIPREQTNGDIHRDVTENTSKVEERNQKNAKLSSSTKLPVVVNLSTRGSRKRRLEDRNSKKSQRQSSASDVEPISENLQGSDDEKEDDVGGKRVKIRNKLITARMRKKVEAQRKSNETSSSGEEDLADHKSVPTVVCKSDDKLNAKSNDKSDHDLDHKSDRDSDHKPIQNLDPVEPHREEIKKNVLPLKAKLKKAAIKSEIEEETIASSAKGHENGPEQVKIKIDPETDNKEIHSSLSPQPQSEITKDDNCANQGGADNLPAKNTSSHSKNDKESDSKEEKSNNTSADESMDITSDLQTSTSNENGLNDSRCKSTESETDEKITATPQRKCSGDGIDVRITETEPKKSHVTEPPSTKMTRSSRRNGPPELTIELPPLRRSRNKTHPNQADLPKEIEVKKEDPEDDPEIKTEQNGTITKEEEVKVSLEDSKPVLTTKSSKVDEELKIEKEDTEEKLPAKPKALPTHPIKHRAAEKQPAAIRRPKHNVGVDTKNILDFESDLTPVRQSRRIAQLKIREEAERRKLEEIALRNMKAELKKKKKAQKADDPAISEPSENSSDHNDSEMEMKKKIEKKKKTAQKGGWSSGSDDPEEEEEEQEQYESDPGSPLFKSDHEFSPESEIEDDSQLVPMKRARTAGKEGDEVLVNSDEMCQKCGKPDHPEWILLCDKCDKGYHCSCLSPVIFYIPEGDWFCPPCQQIELISSLERHLEELDSLVLRKKEEEKQAKIRLELEEIAARVRAEQTKEEKKNNKIQKTLKDGRQKAYHKNKRYDDSGEESGNSDTDATDSTGSSSSSSSTSGSATDSDDEPIYKLRKRRQINVSYRLNEYDDMIKSALKEEEDEVAGAGNLGRGKDISTIIEADKEEKLRQQQLIGAQGEQDPTEIVQKPPNAGGAEDSGSDFEPLKRKPKVGRFNRKKGRKLTKLDISSEGDDSDEDFKTSSIEDDDEEEDEEDEDTQSSDSSLEIYRKRGRRGGKSKKRTRRAARRAARERRKVKNFIVDDSDFSEEKSARPKKKKRKRDSDYTESETNDDELSENIDSEDLCDDSTDSEASDGAWRPSKRKNQHSTGGKGKSKAKGKPAAKVNKAKRPGESNRGYKPGNAKRFYLDDDSEDDDDDDSIDSSRRTRGKKGMYLEDFEDDSSDGGIKPGVKRPDTPPEEREKFIQKQEEIKRMLAEKNAEGAKLAATPRLVPIKGGTLKPPPKVDSLSTVPASVIRQAKVLDIDYLQRKGESISEGDLDESEFDDDELPDDFNPDDMDEDAIARMVEEEDFAQQQLKFPPPSEILRKRPAKELDVPIRPNPPTIHTPHMLSTPILGLQEPVRKKLPIPTIHPPLLRHQQGAPQQQAFQQNRSSTSTHLPLLQNALNAPPNHPLARTYPPMSQSIPATVPGVASLPGPGSTMAAGGETGKPRGRRKKITPLRDPLQKQQAAAAASAAAAAATSKPRAVIASAVKSDQKLPPAHTSLSVATPGVIKSALSVAQPPQLYKPPLGNSQPSVITRMPHLHGRPMMPVGSSPFGDQGHRFYRPSQPQPPPPPSSQPQTRPPPSVLMSGSGPPLRHRGLPMPPLSAHHGLRPSFVGGPPPLRPTGSVPLDSREHGQSRPVSYSRDQQYAPPPARHASPSAPTHLNPYRSQVFGNPGFPHRGAPPNLTPSSAMRPPGAPSDYSPSGPYVGGYGYYPPPVSVSHSAPPPPTASAVPSSVIVSASSLSSAPSTSTSGGPPLAPTPIVVPSRLSISSVSLVEKSCPPSTAPVPTKVSTPSVIELTRKKLTTLETFNTSKMVTPPPAIAESSESRSPYSSNPPLASGIEDSADDASGSPIPQSTSEFSGLVSYFSSQHDDLNT